MEVPTRGPVVRVVSVALSPMVGVSLVQVTLSTFILAGLFSRGDQSSLVGSYRHLFSDRRCLQCGKLRHFIRDCPRFRQGRKQGQLVYAPRAPSPLAEMVHKVVGVVPRVLYVLLGQARQ
ncbi:hypothetical protein HAX54_031385, partial [Datura stramonium]|nr:hypothetical protein [Datura stramonium]